MPFQDAIDNQLKVCAKEWLRRHNANLIADGRGEPIPFPELYMDSNEEDDATQ